MDQEILKIWAFLTSINGIWYEVQEDAKKILSREKDPDFPFTFKTKLFIEQLNSILDHVAFYLSIKKDNKINFPFGKNEKQLEKNLYQFESHAKVIFEKVQPYNVSCVYNLRTLASLYKHKFIKLLVYEEKKVYHEEFFSSLGDNENRIPIIIGSVDHKLKGQKNHGKYFLQRELAFDTSGTKLENKKILLLRDILEAYELIHSLVKEVFILKHGRCPNGQEMTQFQKKQF